MTVRNYYEELGLSTDASQEAIRDAYRSLAKQVHPDRVGGDAQRMTRINQAYETLGDPVRRGHYDAQHLKLASHKRPTTPAPFDPRWLYYQIIEPLDAELQRVQKRLLEQLEELSGDPFDAVLSRQFEREVTKIDQEIASVTSILAREEAPWPWHSVLGYYEQGLRQLDDALAEFKSFMLDFDLDHLVDGKSILLAAQEILLEARDRMRSLL